MKALFLAIFLISCGKNVTTKVTEYVENPYDASKIEALDLIQDARLNAIEARLADLNALIDENTADIQALTNSIDTQFNAVNASLNSIQAQVSTNKVTVMQICASGENLIKMNNEFYAVYMVSNNFGTYLGKLTNNVNYMSTDSVRATFHINNGNIICH